MDRYYYLDGLVLWTLDAKKTLHRLDGPAVEWNDGSKFWFMNGKLHRKDGPAVEYASGEKSWYINGKELDEEKFEKTILMAKLSGLLNG